MRLGVRTVQGEASGVTQCVYREAGRSLAFGSIVVGRLSHAPQPLFPVAPTRFGGAKP